MDGLNPYVISYQTPVLKEEVAEVNVSQTDEHLLKVRLSQLSKPALDAMASSEPVNEIYEEGEVRNAEIAQTELTSRVQKKSHDRRLKLEQGLLILVLLASAVGIARHLKVKGLPNISVPTFPKIDFSALSGKIPFFGQRG